jgi:hypothetical protein
MLAFNPNAITRDRIAAINEEALLLEPEYFDEAIMGMVERLGAPPTVLYSEEKVLEILMREHEFELEDAREWYDFNIVGAYMGEGSPTFLIQA